MATQISASETKSGLIRQSKKHKNGLNTEKYLHFLRTEKEICHQALKSLQNHNHVMEHVRLNQVHQNRNGKGPIQAEMKILKLLGCRPQN